MTLPKALGKYFWETDFSALDSERNQDYIAERLMEYGDLDAARWLLRAIGTEPMKEIVASRRGLSPKSRVFWSLFLGFSDSAIRKCLQKFYPKERTPLWKY